MNFATTALSLSALCASALPAAKISEADHHPGVNVGGWLLIEEWMFSNGMFDKVAEDKDKPQGVILPPELPNGFGEKWYAEGDLINKLVDKFGEDRTMEILTRHRETYVTAEDFKTMKSVGLSQVRIPLGWWAFIDESKSSDPVVITDPYHQDRKFVTIPQQFLKNTISEVKDAGLSVLLDIHAFPGGSADGSYNGIFPNTPMFFRDESLQQKGLDIVTALCDFFLDLDAAQRDSISGMTLMNEPAHLIAEDGDAMVAWLSQAVDIYRRKVVNNASVHTPLLYVNLIETSLSPAQMLDFMVDNFSEEELSQWAVLDVHKYYAWDWGASGCMVANNDCAYACDVDTDVSTFDSMKQLMSSNTQTSHSYYLSNGSVPLVSCSEYSLATYHDSENACRGKDTLDVMYDSQLSGFIDQGLYNAIFWTWKMPYGGSHEDSWSLSHYLGVA